jgi:hypothetical protein
MIGLGMFSRATSLRALRTKEGLSLGVEASPMAVVLEMWEEMIVAAADRERCESVQWI